MDMIRIRLAEIAKERGKNMSQVQRETGLTMGMVRRYWNSDTESVKLDAIEQLCSLLGVEVGEMLTIEKG